MTPDAAIERLIRRILLRDHRLSSQHIRVAVQDGFVTLHGRVRSVAEKAVAGELASRVLGVCTVLNRLDVVPGSVLPDAVVAECVRMALEEDPRIVKDAITVCVRDGVITLEGTVCGDGERLIALDIALGIDGVRAIRASLLIDPVRRIEDALVAREVKGEIHRVIGDQSRVRVAVSAGMAVLSGRVATHALRRRAESVAQAFGLSSLQNEIEVEGQDNTSPEFGVDALPQD